jgi:hypothetical protein
MNTQKTIGRITTTTSTRAKRQLLEKAAVFLRVLGIAPDVRPLMERAGYSPKMHTLGWQLFKEAAEPRADAALENPARAAYDELKELRPSVLTRVRAALHHDHPDQEQLVFADDGVDLMSGDALAAVATFLDRIQALRDSPERKATRKDDQAALRGLAERALDDAFFAHLAELVAVAGTDATGDDLAPPISVANAQVEADQAALDALAGWLEEWTRVARITIKRRDSLIRLGVSHRATKGKAAAVAPPVAARW